MFTFYGFFFSVIFLNGVSSQRVHILYLILELNSDTWTLTPVKTLLKEILTAHEASMVLEKPQGIR